MLPPDHRLRAAGDSALILELGDTIDEALNRRAIRIAAVVERRRIPGVRDVVPTYRSVAVYFDPLRVDYESLTRMLNEEATNEGPVESGFSRVAAAPIRIPVKYGGDAGPDLAVVAAFAGLSEDDVIARHQATVYRVFMMGFLPGFPYMGTVDPAIAAPRRATPRLRVPAGSVGIAGQQTGIYPTESPGGWQLVGRTDTRLFDVTRREPFLLEPGDAVQFFAV
jgi:KipI family sensor histidine kinase inhibitor